MGVRETQRNREIEKDRGGDIERAQVCLFAAEFQMECSVPAGTWSGICGVAC